MNEFKILDDKKIEEIENLKKELKEKNQKNYDIHMEMKEKLMKLKLEKE